MSCTCQANPDVKPIFKDSSIDIDLLEPCFEKYASQPGSLIPILQTAQELFGYLPIDLLAYIAKRTNIPAAKILGVVTFYTQFRTKPVGKNLILLCQGTACHVNGSGAIEAAIREFVGVDEGEISEDGLFTYNNVACLGCCSLAPAMMIGETTYGTLNKEKAQKILAEIKEAAQ